MTRKQKRLTLEVARTLIAITVITGFFLVIGSAGALENDQIGFGQFVIQTLIGFGKMSLATLISPN